MRCESQMELRPSLYAWRGCAVTTMMLIRLCMPLCRDKLHFRCVSARHRDQQPHEFVMTHKQFFTTEWGCKACADAYVLALSSSSVGGVD